MPGGVDKYCIVGTASMAKATRNSEGMTDYHENELVEIVGARFQGKEPS